MNILNCIDYFDKLAIWFTYPMSPSMNGIIALHNYIFFFIWVILNFVIIFIILNLVRFRYKITHVVHKEFFAVFASYYVESRIWLFSHSPSVELIWTFIPGLILGFIGWPSIKLLYAIDEMIDPLYTVIIIGNQWYWTYEYSDFNVVSNILYSLDSFNFKFDEYYFKNFNNNSKNKNLFNLSELIVKNAYNISSFPDSFKKSNKLFNNFVNDIINFLLVNGNIFNNNVHIENDDEKLKTFFLKIDDKPCEFKKNWEARFDDILLYGQEKVEKIWQQTRVKETNGVPLIRGFVDLIGTKDKNFWWNYEYKHAIASSVNLIYAKNYHEVVIWLTKLFFDETSINNAFPNSQEIASAFAAFNIPYLILTYFNVWHVYFNYFYVLDRLQTQIFEYIDRYPWMAYFTLDVNQPIVFNTPSIVSPLLLTTEGRNRWRQYWADNQCLPNMYGYLAAIERKETIKIGSGGRFEIIKNPYEIDAKLVLFFLDWFFNFLLDCNFMSKHTYTSKHTYPYESFFFDDKIVKSILFTFIKGLEEECFFKPKENKINLYTQCITYYVPRSPAFFAADDLFTRIHNFSEQYAKMFSKIYLKKMVFGDENSLYSCLYKNPQITPILNLGILTCFFEEYIYDKKKIFENFNFRNLIKTRLEFLTINKEQIIENLIELLRQKDDQKILYDCFIIPEEDLPIGFPRLLATDQVLILPVNTHLRLLVTSSDVIHSWALPSHGIKIDGVPGRLNQIPFFTPFIGTSWGQCSELCGINHGFMPIEIRVVPIKGFLSFIKLNLNIKYNIYNPIVLDYIKNIWFSKMFDFFFNWNSTPKVVTEHDIVLNFINSDKDLSKGNCRVYTLRRCSRNVEHLKLFLDFVLYSLNNHVKVLFLNNINHDEKLLLALREMFKTLSDTTGFYYHINPIEKNIFIFDKQMEIFFWSSFFQGELLVVNRTKVSKLNSSNFNNLWVNPEKYKRFWLYEKI